MSRRVFRWVILIALTAGLSYPITREMQARADIKRDMINALDVNAAALRQWPGSVSSFVAVLHERCMSSHDRNTDACARYQPPQ
jgi:hypothetical protein